MVETIYTEPVSKLLTYGDCLEIDEQVEDPERDRLFQALEKGGADSLSRDWLSEFNPLPKVERWPKYVEELGLTQAHVPELIRMATDDELNRLPDDDLAVWAPVHAWRCLGQLKAEEAITPLIRYYFGRRQSDWAMEELPWVLSLIGESAIAPLSKYLSARKNKVRGRVSALEGLDIIGRRNLNLKGKCLEVLVAQLSEYQRNSEEMNGFLASSVINLGGVQHAELIEAVYQSGRIDETICGTWPSVQVDLGLAKEEVFDPEELKLPKSEWADSAERESDKPTAYDLGVHKKGQRDEPYDELSVVYGKGKLKFGKRKAKGQTRQKKKGFSR